MTAMQKRVKNVIERIGDTFTVGGISHKGVMTVLNPSSARDYLAQSDIDAAARPLRLLYVPYDDSTLVGGSVVWASIALTVRKMVEVRYRDYVIAKLYVLY
jgi:hypothetical protein